MPVKKVEETKKEAVKKAPAKSTKKTTAKTSQKAIADEKIETVKEDLVINDVVEQPSISPIFDIFTYRELFMALRQKLDVLAEKKDRSEKDYEAYDSAVFNLTTQAATEIGVQDFLGYCYKKGKYDFCLMNYEKYMKWSILAAANGNAFTLSKMQIFLTNAVDEVLTLEHHDYMLDFLELSPENYYLLISKMICEEMVKNLNITAESLIKMSEVYKAQNEELLRLFDNSKIEAAKAVKSNLKAAIDQLNQLLERERQKEERASQKPELEKTQAEEPVEEKENTEQEPEKTEKEKASIIRKSVSKRKFRW